MCTDALDKSLPYRRHLLIVDLIDAMLSPIVTTDVVQQLAKSVRQR
jgi:hypothetical protein